MVKVVNPIDRHVGARIRMRRTTVGMSQSELAGGLKIAYQQVQKYENGANRITAGRLHQLASILNVPTAFFFEGAPLVNVGAPGFAEPEGDRPLLADPPSIGQGLHLSRRFAAIADPKVRKQIVDLVEALVSDVRETKGVEHVMT
jgi:transcriptional regulator with XRE-family HTH domain